MYHLTLLNSNNIEAVGFYIEKLIFRLLKKHSKKETA